jgi:hypothetical protein
MILYGEIFEQIFMRYSKPHRTILIMLFIFYAGITFGSNDVDPRAIIIPPATSLPIGIKIWFNECGGNVEGLTSWNEGENFASLGIGHFLWHPPKSKQATYNSGFPSLLRYIKERGIEIPYWLDGPNGLYCPWRNRNEFINAQNSPKMIALRNFLQRTIPIQAEYMSRHLQDILPDLLTSTPLEDRWLIHDKFYSLARTPSGIYALVDYLNFKGSGIGSSQRNYEQGSGLLQVLRGMKFAPEHYTPLQAYVWSAKKALIRRLNNISSRHHAERWLAGWFNRLNTYLDGDLKNPKGIMIN